MHYLIKLKNTLGSSGNGWKCKFKWKWIYKWVFKRLISWNVLYD